jgi:hypothetical protein
MSLMASRHRVAAAACVLVLLSRGEAAAQSPCELRVGSGAVGGSVGILGAEADVDFGSAGEGLWSQSGTKSGRDVSAEFSVPIMPGWGARLDYGRGQLDVEREITATRPYVVLDRTRVGEVTMRHLTGAIVHALSPPGRLCGYLGVGGGLYQFDYAGRRARNGGLMGLLGVEFGVGERSGLAFEIQLHAIHNDSEPPLKSEVVVMLKPAVLFRVHF